MKRGGGGDSLVYGYGKGEVGGRELWEHRSWVGCFGWCRYIAGKREEGRGIVYEERLGLEWDVV